VDHIDQFPRALLVEALGAALPFARSGLPLQRGCPLTYSHATMASSPSPLGRCLGGAMFLALACSLAPAGLAGTQNRFGLVFRRGLSGWRPRSATRRRALTRVLFELSECI